MLALPAALGRVVDAVVSGSTVDAAQAGAVATALPPLPCQTTAAVPQRICAGSKRLSAEPEFGTTSPAQPASTATRPPG